MRSTRIVTLVSLILLVYIAINIYIGWHGLVMLSHFNIFVPQSVYWIIFSIVAFSYIVGRTRLLPGPLGRLLKVIGSYYFAIVEFALLLLPIADIAAWLMHVSGIDAAVYVPVLSMIVIVVLLIVMIRGSWNAWRPIVRTYELHVEKKASAFKELRVAVASDIHLGNVVGKRHLRRLVERVKDMNPDLILLPGDVIDDSIEPFMRNNMSEVMGQLQAPLGIYAVLGNHEYYGGHIDEYIKQMNKIGIRVLSDESVCLEEAFYIVGRKDKSAETMDEGGRKSITALLADLDLSLPVIAMDHQPYHLDKAEAAGVDVLLSGHTHRGQFAPNHWITRRLFELDWGYIMKNKMHAIVSSGFGTWGPPIRIASRSEIVQLVIRFK